MSRPPCRLSSCPIIPTRGDASKDTSLLLLQRARLAPPSRRDTQFLLFYGSSTDSASDPKEARGTAPGGIPQAVENFTEPCRDGSLD